MGGVPCVRYMRIPVATVLRLLAGGLTERGILSEYPDLQTEDIASACASPKLRNGAGTAPSALSLKFLIDNALPPRLAALSGGRI